MLRSLIVSLPLLWLSGVAALTAPTLEARLHAAGDNRPELERALKDTPQDQRPGMEFLILHMPETDLTSLSAGFLLDNVRWTYEARRNSPWGAEVPDDIFLNDVLPYASINERRDNWREDFYRRFFPMVEDCRTISEAACRLNEKVFATLNVRYSTQRRRADQSPYQSIETGLASCTGLSILLIDAARAVGIPARFAGTPMWTNKRGNHSWVEIWDARWRFTGAAEPDGRGLDHAWFVGDAANADPDNPRHCIYATSFRSTGSAFPMVWDRSIDWIPAVDVTKRYIALRRDPGDQVQALVDVWEKPGGQRVSVEVSITAPGNEEPLARGRSRDASNDTNDILSLELSPNTDCQIEIRTSPEAEPLLRSLRTSAEPSQRFDFFLEPSGE